MILYSYNRVFYFFIFLSMPTWSSPKSVSQAAILSRITFRNILLLALGFAIWVGGTISIYSATDSTISNIVTMVNTQCNKDIACIREVATGLERAVATLTSVISELRTQVKDTPASPTPPTLPRDTPWGVSPSSVSPEYTSGSSSSQKTPDTRDLGCYYRMSDPNKWNDKFKDLIQTYRIDHQGRATGLASSHASCKRITLTCADTRIQALDELGSPIQIPLSRAYVEKNNESDIQYLVYSSQSGAYLWDILWSCTQSEEYRQTVPSSPIAETPVPISIQTIGPKNPKVRPIPVETPYTPGGPTPAPSPY